MIKRLPVLAAAVGLLLAPLAGTASAETTTPAKPAVGSAVTSGVWNTATYNPDGNTNTVEINQYVGSNGHHYVTGWLYAGSTNVAFYYDQSFDGGRTWNSFLDRRYVGPGGWYTLPEKYDDGGVWYRACSAAEWAGSPYANPQWGYNIACTNWY
ncbi:hypothetical protein [Kitasatospora aureofaciens]|uniref:hypothetical protein n=1 Tax=Kitasatospora aureofaciens TaxID=1894 RepID=UPI0005245C7A|nr:hypothetical protein [Kitasatospora aureofaciens]